MNQYVKLLCDEIILRRLSAIQLISYFGAWFSNVAIYTLLLKLDVSAGVISFVAMLHFLAGVVQAPFSGSLIDKLHPKRLMLLLVFVEIVSTLGLLRINSMGDLPLLYLLIFVKMAAASFYFTTEMSLLPKILQGNRLQKANELHSIIWSLSYTLGMAISGFIVFWLGIKVAFLLDALLFVIAFALLYPLQIEVDIQTKGERLLTMMQETFGYLKKRPKALHLMLVHAFVGLSTFDALVALMVDKYYAGIIATSLALGLLHASRAIGLVVGPMILGKWVNNKRLLVVFVAQALAIFVWAYFMHNFYLTLFISIAVGFFTTTLWSYSYTLLQKNIEPRYYGRIVAYNDMLFLSSAAFTSFMIGFLATKGVSLENIANIMGVGFLVGALYYAFVRRRYQLKEIEG
ncbi:MAG: MFS transporter [Epsilonproteobacteria bacterium]|nr:MFS transporter [Campylobacterota bacterium]